MQTLKLTNESLGKCLQKIKQVMLNISDLFTQARNLSVKDSVSSLSTLLVSLCEEVLSLKVEMQTIATLFKKKSQLQKGAKGLASYETKSNNLSVLREDT